jgi:opacity protein-like surface antigen
MKIQNTLVALAALVATASSHAASPESGSKPDPTHGAYLLFDFAPLFRMSANWSCQVSTSYLCNTPTRIDYRSVNRFNKVPGFEVGVGYTFNRYFAIEASGGYLTGGPNDRDDTYMNDNLQFDVAATASVAVRGDLPITHNVSLYVKYGIGRQVARMSYDEKDYGSEIVTGNPTTVFRKSFSGTFRPMSVGLSFQSAGGNNYRLAYTRHTAVGSFSYSAITFGVDYVLTSTWR